MSLELGGVPGGGGGASGAPSGFGDASELSLSASSASEISSASIAASADSEVDAPAMSQVAEPIETAHAPVEPDVSTPPVAVPEPVHQNDAVPEPVAVAEPVPSEPSKAERSAETSAEPVPIPRKTAPESEKKREAEIAPPVTPKEPARIRKVPAVRTDRRASATSVEKAAQTSPAPSSGRPAGLGTVPPKTAEVPAPGFGPRFVPSAGQGSGTGGAHGDGSSPAGGGGTGGTGLGSGSGSGGGGEGLMSFGSPGGPGVEHMVLPEYPREARRLGKEGVVVLKLSLDADGMVESVEVLETPGYGLDDAAREAVQRSRFHPATVGGVPVACRAILPINFRLR
jgi:protein TonB